MADLPWCGLRSVDLRHCHGLRRAMEQVGENNMSKLAYISVNKQTVARNSRSGSKDAAIAIRFGKSGVPTYVNEVEINGPSRLVYDPAKPILRCGARLVLVTDAANVRLSQSGG